MTSATWPGAHGTGLDRYRVYGDVALGPAPARTVLLSARELGLWRRGRGRGSSGKEPPAVRDRLTISRAAVAEVDGLPLRSTTRWARVLILHQCAGTRPGPAGYPAAVGPAAGGVD